MVFSTLAQASSPFTFFDGPPNRLRPAFKASTLSSGMLGTIGTMIAHSILMDGQRFPYLAEYCYYYIAGCSDQAITCITDEDLSSEAKSILNKVCGLKLECPYIIAKIGSKCELQFSWNSSRMIQILNTETRYWN